MTSPPGTPKISGRAEHDGIKGKRVLILESAALVVPSPIHLHLHCHYASLNLTSHTDCPCVCSRGRVCGTNFQQASIDILAADAFGANHTDRACMKKKHTTGCVQNPENRPAIAKQILVCSSTTLPGTQKLDPVLGKWLPGPTCDKPGYVCIFLFLGWYIYISDSLNREVSIENPQKRGSATCGPPPCK